MVSLWISSCGSRSSSMSSSLSRSYGFCGSVSGSRTSVAAAPSDKPTGDRGEVGESELDDESTSTLSRGLVVIASRRAKTQGETASRARLSYCPSAAAPLIWYLARGNNNLMAEPIDAHIKGYFQTVDHDCSTFCRKSEDSDIVDQDRTMRRRDRAGSRYKGVFWPVARSKTWQVCLNRRQLHAA